MSSLLQIYKALILSKLEYSSFLLTNAKESALKMIDTVHNASLRLTTGAFHSSPIASILNIAGVAPLDIRRTQSIRLLATRRTQNNFKVMKQLKEVLENIPYPYSDVIKNETMQPPAWTPNIYINRTLSELPKKNIIPIIYKQQLQIIISELHGFIEISTDGSKRITGVGAAVVFQNLDFMLRLPNFSSIYTAEAVEI